MAKASMTSETGHRWAIEDSFETAKNEFGLDHNESDPGTAGIVTQASCPKDLALMVGLFAFEIGQFEGRGRGSA